MDKAEKAEKEFLNGDISVNDLREKKGLKPVDGGDILLTGEKRRVFYLCNGKVPCCGKRSCYKNGNTTEDACRHTSNVEYAVNFRKGLAGENYFEKEAGQSPST